MFPWLLFASEDDPEAAYMLHSLAEKHLEHIFGACIPGRTAGVAFDRTTLERSARNVWGKMG